jgi:hypothetical protein
VPPQQEPQHDSPQE